MKRGLVAVIVTVVFLSLAVSVYSETLKTKDGRVFHGKVLEQDNEKVIFEVMRFGATIRTTFSRSDILSITSGDNEPEPVKPPKSSKEKTSTIDIAPEPPSPPVIKYDKPTYYIIPFEGKVGTRVLASHLERYLEDAMKRKPSVVLIVFDSPGGIINEVGKLVAVIKKYNSRLKIVAYVRNALSAAAITGLACREIYFEPQAVFGAATAYKMTVFGLPEAISEKFQSVWRAQARSAAEIGGHNPLLAEAMIDANMELYLVKNTGSELTIDSSRYVPGQRTPDRAEPRIHKIERSARRGKLISARGKLLTLTSSEAVDCGLGKGVVDNYDQLGKKMGFTGWVECKGHAVALDEHWEKALSIYMKRINDLGLEFNRNMMKAMESNPETPNITYKYYRNTGKFTPESRRRWRILSRKKSICLLKAEKNITEAIKITQKVEQLSSVTENLDILLKYVNDARMDVIADMNKAGPDG